jgi:hypothetical protein
MAGRAILGQKKTIRPLMNYGERTAFIRGRKICLGIGRFQEERCAIKFSPPITTIPSRTMG